MHSRHLENYFPNLRQTGYEVKSGQDSGYNCIAWAAGDDGYWWEPNSLAYWPREPQSDSVREYIEIFQFMGFKICDSVILEPSYEKVAIYVDQNNEPSHMARQLASGLWTSKCGEFEDIEHTLEGLESDLYGKVEIVMKRPRFSKSLELDIQMK